MFTIIEINGKMKLVVEDVQKRRRILSNAHDTQHLGVNRMLDIASKYYYNSRREIIMHV